MKTKPQAKDTKKSQKPQRKLPDLAVKKDVRGGENVSFVFAKPAVEYKP
jgi:hypothetical protein